MMNPQKQLQDLNEDCLLAIFHKLSKYDYWRLRNVSKYFHEFITNGYCPRHYKYWRDTNPNFIMIYQTTTLSLSRFKWFLDYMYDVADVVEMNALSVEHLELLEERNIILEKVQTLIIRSQILRCNAGLPKEGERQFTEQTLPNIASILAKFFPNVEKLSYSGYISDTTGFSQLSKLKHLEIHHAESANKRLRISDDFFECLKLNSLTIWWPANQDEVIQVCEGILKRSDTLEAITVSSEFSGKSLQMLSNYNLPHLRRFTIIDIYVDTWIDTVICETLVQRIRKISSNVSGWCVPYPMEDSDGHFESLCEMNIGADILACHDLEKLTHHFPHLSKVNFLNSATVFQQYHSEESISTLTFLGAITSSPQIKILSIPLEWVRYRFQLRSLQNVVRKQLQRTDPLELHCFVRKDLSKGERNHLLQNLRKDEEKGVLEVHFVDLPDEKTWDYEECEYIEFELIPDFLTTHQSLLDNQFES